ncbi:hypothetical protein [Paenibacillus aceris]|uniref:Uncharacterized protein n=1 Tax=Paenibacillus aceris TaxID=869555 RepID=A0ABS4HX73_9BACL|nr:hypothetical protein [Paenibacillus aceris]MBP1963274.1 hypothetical protein [Paenibacillus aceris]NHW36217.1 hypothetical protein [Paenibacillus aceris]
MFLINSKTIEVLDATLSGVMNHDGFIEWYINIDCDSAEFDGINTSPRIYLERYEWGISCIEEITNKEINIEKGSSLSNDNMFPGESLCCLYAFEHQFLDENQISFYLKSEDLYISWKAKNSNNYPERFEVDVDTKIDFLGINLGETKDSETAKKLIRFDTSGLDYYKEEGTLYLIPVEKK